MCAASKTSGGVIYMLPDVLISLLYLVPLLFVWRTVMSGGGAAGVDMRQALTYAYINALFGQMLVVQSELTEWNYSGQIINLFLRPYSLFGQVISRTIGRWLPMLCVYSLPMLAIAPLVGINTLPANWYALPSMLLCIYLGFAIDFLFACLAMRLRNVNWLIHVVRMAIISFFSGSVIPFKLLPQWIAQILELQPFGSLGGAVLAIYSGISAPIPIIATQIAWNVILWPLAIIIFKKSQEVMMSYGG